MKCNGLREEEERVFDNFKNRDVLGRGNLPGYSFPGEVEAELKVVGSGLGMRAVVTCSSLCMSRTGNSGRCYQRVVLRSELEKLVSRSGELVYFRSVLKKGGNSCWVKSQAESQLK